MKPKYKKHSSHGSYGTLSSDVFPPTPTRKRKVGLPNSRFAKIAALTSLAATTKFKQALTGRGFRNEICVICFGETVYNTRFKYTYCAKCKSIRPAGRFFPWELTSADPYYKTKKCLLAHMKSNHYA